MSETAIKPTLTSSSYSVNGNWRIGCLVTANILEFPSDQFEAMRRSRIADMTPSDDDFELASSPPPASWYREQW